MSWQAYVDSSLVSTGKVDKAAIFSKAGDSVWATTAGFAIKPEEIKHVVQGFVNSAPLHGNGIYLAEQKYFAISANDSEIVGKKGKEGIICALTKQALIVVHHPDTVMTPDALGVVVKLKDYLIGVGY